MQTSTIEDTAAEVLSPKVRAAVVETFARHAAQSRGGMQFSVFHAGEPVLRLCGGVAGKGGDASARPWDPHTLAVIFSGTKGLVAIIAAMAVGKGLLDVDAPVCDYWPEFAAEGKDRATVSHVLSHTVGLPYLDPDPSSALAAAPGPDPSPVPDAAHDPGNHTDNHTSARAGTGIGNQAFLDSRAMASILAGQRPLWEPGTKIAYHGVTYGYLMSEIILRATGRSIAQWLRDVLAGPLGLDLHLGLPAEDEDRVAPIVQAPGYRVAPHVTDPDRRGILDRMYSSLLSPDLPMNTREFHAAELAAGGGIGAADSLAKLYSLLVTPGRLGGGIVDPEALAAAVRTRSSGLDCLTDRPLRFGLGFELADPLGTYGPVSRAFGHSGAGGGLHGAWPDQGLGFSFLTNEMISDDVDTRAKDLVSALAGEVRA